MREHETANRLSSDRDRKLTYRKRRTDIRDIRIGLAENPDVEPYE